MKNHQTCHPGHPKWLGLLLVLLTLLPVVGTRGAETTSRAPAAVREATPSAALEDPQALADREREIDKQHLRQIYDALQAHKRKHGDLPNWLSDLFPEFLSDPGILMSPVELRTGRSQLWGYGDPKMASSYVYEFNQASAGGDRDRDESLTMKQWKMRQMEEFGPAIPILRCHLHDPILNVSYSGDLYETALFWETDTNTLALTQKVGIGPGAKDGKRIRVVIKDAATGDAIAGAEVKATNRRSELGPLPPRTFAADDQGVCEVNLGGRKPEGVTLQVFKPGYASQQVQWVGADMPPEWAATLPPAVAIGGLVQDEERRPIAGATVHVIGIARDQVGQFIPMEYDAVVTDASGQWRSERVPKKFEGLSLKLTHPQFMPTEYDQSTEDNATGNVLATDALVEAKAVMVMPPAMRVEGTVTDNQQQPLSGATVLLASGENWGQRQQLQTGKEGRFRFFLFEAGVVQLVVQARGYAPQQQPVEVQPDVKPLTFALTKGVVLKGRVLDDENKPVAEAEVAAAEWRGASLLDWRTQTDADGRFRWDSAPSDPMMLVVSKSGFNDMGHSVSGTTGEELTLQLSKTFQLSGKVVDAETKEPIPTFHLMSGFSWNPGDDQQVNWERQERTAGRNGTYSVSLPYPRGGQVKFMAFADGYLPAASPAYPESGWHTCDFELKKGSGPKGRVVTADDQPVEGARVSMLGLGYLSLAKADFRAVGGNDVAMTRTDAQGQFSLPALLPSPRLVAVHERGYAEIAFDDLAASGKMVLQPWGRIEGVLRFGTKPAPDQEVMVSQRSHQPGDLNLDFNVFKTRTDDQGRFTFTYVPPGERQLVRLIPRGDRSWTHSHNQRIRVKAGQPTEVACGGTGRPIIGKVVLSSPRGEVDWNQGFSSLSTKFPRPPSNLRNPEEARAWQNSPEVKAAQEDARHYALSISADGSFRIEDVPAGAYDLRIDLREPGGNNPGMGVPIGNLVKEVVVPEMPGGRSDEPLDVGELTLQVRSQVKPVPQEP